MSLGNMEQRTEEMKKQVLELLDRVYVRGYIDGENSRINECAKALDEAVIAGRDEAWEAAKKIVNLCQGQSCVALDWLNDCSASEAIEKIRVYEEQKREEDNEIHVGDEVIYNCGKYKDKATVIDIDMDVLHLLTENGCYLSEEFKDVKKTGRHFTEIAELLKKLREEK